MEEEQLDRVDVIVFDAQASGRVRQEALTFLMDHTEGFDELPAAEGDAEEEEEEGGNPRSKAGAAKKRLSAAATTAAAEGAKALARRQRTAMQLETLTEFAEHHLVDQLEHSRLLAEACLLLPNYGEFVCTH